MELTDADLDIKTNESVKIKPANDIYYELYRVAKEKARTARKLAFDAYLEVKNKKTYMLDDSDSDFSNSSESENSENTEDSENSDD